MTIKLENEIVLQLQIPRWSKVKTPHDLFKCLYSHQTQDPGDKLAGEYCVDFQVVDSESENLSIKTLHGTLSELAQYVPECKHYSIQIEGWTEIFYIERRGNYFFRFFL